MAHWYLFLLLPLLLPPLLLYGLHRGMRAPRLKERGTPADCGLEYSQLQVPTVGGHRLYGWLVPAGDAPCTLILLHGWGGNAEVMLPLALPFHRAGFNLLLFDARNHGRSDEDGFSSMPKFAEDLGQMIDWLKQNHPDACQSILLLGHSVGAAAVLLEVARRSDISAVISLSAFAHPEGMMRRYLSTLRLPEPLLRLVLEYIQWRIGWRFDAIAPANTIRKVSCPVLLVHGSADLRVPPSDAREILAAGAKERVALLEVEGAGHESVEHIEQQGERLVAFAREALQPAPPGSGNLY